MTDPKTELLQVIRSYEEAARGLPASHPDIAGHVSGLQPRIDSTLRCLRRLAQTVSLRSREAEGRFRQVVSQARAFLRMALAGAGDHPLACIFELFRGAKTLLQDLIHSSLVDEDGVLRFGRSEVKDILAHLSFPPRKGSKLRAAAEAA